MPRKPAPLARHKLLTISLEKDLANALLTVRLSCLLTGLDFTGKTDPMPVPFWEEWKIWANRHLEQNKARYARFLVELATDGITQPFFDLSPQVSIDARKGQAVTFAVSGDPIWKMAFVQKMPTVQAMHEFCAALYQTTDNAWEAAATEADRHGLPRLASILREFISVCDV